MKKNGLRVFAASAAVCLMAGLVAIGNGGAAKADANGTCDYTFEDGNVGEFNSNGVAFSIEEGLNSNAGAEFGENVTGNNCLKVSNRAKGTDWWERNGACYDLKKLTPGVTYKISVDVSHENDAVEDKGYGVQRAFKMGVYFSKGYQTSGSDIVAADGKKYASDSEEAKQVKETQNAMYNQIGSLKGAEKGTWERLEGTFTVKDDEASLAGNCYLFIFMAYPEKAGQGNNVSYSDKNTEDYFIDNFRVAEVVKATETPATQAPTVTPATQAPAVQAPVQTPVVAVDEPELEVGYEEAVKGITYKVTGKDTVAVVEFDEPKSKLNIPATISFEDDEFSYKVTAINANAFKGESDIKSVTIGANVATIGKNAFSGCKSLKKVTIKSKAIKSIGKKAFKGTAKKITVKSPKAKKAAYKKLLKKAGISKKAKFK